MKSTIRVCVVYSRDLAGMPMVTHGSENFREPQPGSEYPQTAKVAINGRRVNYTFLYANQQNSDPDAKFFMSRQNRLIGCTDRFAVMLFSCFGSHWIGGNRERSLIFRKIVNHCQIKLFRLPKRQSTNSN